jgi:hypothetical protein
MARRVRVQVVAEIAALQNRIDDGQTCERAVAHGDGGRAVQLDHWRPIGANEIVHSATICAQSVPP